LEDLLENYNSVALQNWILWKTYAKNVY
jgi:hypothetical protein